MVNKVEDVLLFQTTALEVGNTNTIEDYSMAPALSEQWFLSKEDNNLAATKGDRHRLGRLILSKCQMLINAPAF